MTGVVIAGRSFLSTSVPGIFGSIKSSTMSACSLLLRKRDAFFAIFGDRDDEAFSAPIFGDKLGELGSRLQSEESRVPLRFLASARIFVTIKACHKNRFILFLLAPSGLGFAHAHDASSLALGDSFSRWRLRLWFIKANHKEALHSVVARPSGARVH